jgi:hypothetical protein
MEVRRVNHFKKNLLSEILTKTKLAAIVIYFLSASDVLLTGVTIWFSSPETYSQESWAHPRGCSSAPLLVPSHNNAL